MGNITFTMIKPEAVKAGNTGAILNRMEERGFRIVSLKKVYLTPGTVGGSGTAPGDSERPRGLVQNVSCHL